METENSVHPLRRVLALVVIAIASLGLASCGDDGGGQGGGDPEAQPSPDGTTFVEGDFGQIPLPPLADPAGERSEIDGVTTASYFVRNRTPREVLEFYEEYFADDGVDVIVGPETFGRDAWRAAWLLDGRELLVTAQPAPTADAERADVVTQLSLELSTEGGGGHSNPPELSPENEE